MGSKTSFGPQGLNATTSLPPSASVNRYGSEKDTWVKDASTPTSKDGTVLDAAFFNRIIGNLRNVVRGAIDDGAAIEMDESDMNLLLAAVRHFGQRGLDKAFLSAAAFKAAQKVTLEPASDRIVSYDTSASVAGYSTPFDIVRSVLQDSSNVKVAGNAKTGRVTLTVDSALNFQSLPTASSIQDNDLLAVMRPQGKVHSSISFKTVADEIKGSIKQLPQNAKGYLYNDGTGSLRYGTPDGTLPPNGAGQLTNDGNGQLTYQRHLPLAGGQMGGPIDMGASLIRLGRITKAQLAVLDPRLYDGAIAHGTSLGGTGYTSGPVFCDGVNWRKVMNNEIVA